VEISITELVELKGGRLTGAAGCEVAFTKYFRGGWTTSSKHG
jgi:hypothetical protein